MLLTVTVGAVQVGSAVIARHRAQASADLAALSAATAMPAGSRTACETATAVTRAMGTMLASCTTDGLDVVVTVDARVALTTWGAGPARAVARAGPVAHP